MIRARSFPTRPTARWAPSLDFQISRTELGIPPHDFRTMTESTRITMWLADQAIRASGLLASDIPRERIGVLISQNSGEAAGTLADIIIRAIHLPHPRRHQEGRSPHAGSGERHRTGDEVRAPGPGRHHPPGPAQLRRGRVHLQPLWVHGTQLFGLRRLRHLTGRIVQRHPDDPERHHRCRRRRRGRGDSQALAFSGIRRPGGTFRAVRDRKGLLTRPPAPSMPKEMGWFSAKAGA